MSKNFVKCGECIYNLSSNPHKVICSVMIMEESVVRDYTEESGCDCGYSQDDAFPECEFGY